MADLVCLARETEVASGLSGLGAGGRAEKARVQDEIAIGRVGSDSEISGPSVEIDGLRARQDDSVTVERERPTRTLASATTIIPEVVAADPRVAPVPPRSSPSKLVRLRSVLRRRP
jgi:hypothetical protein